MTRKMDLQQQADEILRRAEERGVSSNYFFRTTFERYTTQLATLEKLKEAIEEYGPTVTKEYVKGRQNITVNPAISEYNKTSTAANGTVTTLINIIKSMADDDGDGGKLGELIASLSDD